MLRDGIRFVRKVSYRKDDKAMLTEARSRAFILNKETLENQIKIAVKALKPHSFWQRKCSKCCGTWSNVAFVVEIYNLSSKTALMAKTSGAMAHWEEIKPFVEISIRWELHKRSTICRTFTPFGQILQPQNALSPSCLRAREALRISFSE